MSAAIIVARGGSRRIPRKNIREFHGRPMMAWPIGAAVESGVFSRIYVSTEDAEIAAVAQRLGARVIARPDNLARDEVGTQEVMQHAVMAAGIDPGAEVCCIYPCTPLLLPQDLREARRVLVNFSQTNYVVAVDETNGCDTGWFYFARAREFAHGTRLWTSYTRPHPIEKWRAVDVNTWADWQMAESVFEKQQRAA